MLNTLVNLISFREFRGLEANLVLGLAEAFGTSGLRDFQSRALMNSQTRLLEHAIARLYFWYYLHTSAMRMRRYGDKSVACEFCRTFGEKIRSP